MKKNLQRFLMIVLLSVSVHSGYSQLGIPLKENTGTSLKLLNGIWKFKYIPSVDIGVDSGFYNPGFAFQNWKTIVVPGHWELQGFAEPRYHRVDAGTGLYITSFKVSENFKNKQLFLAFDGVLYGYDFWINGKYVGTGSSAFNRKIFDVTPFVAVGKNNTLAVKVTTRNKGFEFDTNDDWTISGIFRDVTFLGVPKTHIKDFVVRTFVSNHNTAQLDLSVLLEKSKGSNLDKELLVTGKLFSPEGKLLKTFTSAELKLKEKDTISVAQNIMVEHAQLWTAETPWLYNLELSLTADKKLIQKINQKIGLRQVSTDNGVLKLNGKPIKLRGVDHHDIEPTVGRAFTAALVLKDLLLMKKANINFIRTSHYPPHPKLIELADSLGIYVMCEVPFGYGDEHLKDSTYLDVLLNRATLTINRDKNHPSVIIWSIGNENPLTPITLETGQFVKKMDPTRPICYPQIGSYFKTIYKDFPDFIDIAAPHYTSPEVMETYANYFHRPVITTEYAHSLGLEFDLSEEMVDLFYKHRVLAGGSVWLFQDQGILRTVDKKVNRDSVAISAWLDSVHVYDNYGDQGADGIVYANRVPQVDYWQLRKVYAPVKINSDGLFIKPGSQQLKIKISNRYDFNDLSEVKCQWVLMADNKIMQQGKLSLKCDPHDSTMIEVPIALTQKLTATFYTLNLQFVDPKGYQFTEKVIRLWPMKSVETGHFNLVTIPMKKPAITQDEQFFMARLGDVSFTLNKQNGNVKIENVNTRQLMLDGPFAHLGRKETMSMTVLRARDKSGVATNWNPYNLKDPVAEVMMRSPNAIECKYRFERVEKKGEFIEGSVIYTISDSGWINVNYHFVPVNATGFLLEAGIAFQVPDAYSEMRWIGNGPYSSYPGKSMLDEFGFYHLNKDDINYQGNRSEVELMLMTNKNGNGFAIKTDRANVAIENIAQKIMLSHNALLSGRYTKFTNPRQLYQAKDVKEFSGSFSIKPMNGNSTFPQLKMLFGDLHNEGVPFKPFYHSYDQ